MKQFISGIVIALALALALVMGVVALAENAGNEEAQLPAAEEMQPEAQAPEAETPETDSGDADLQAALKAWQEARKSAQQEDLQEELDGFVDSGKLTREQADLIMNAYKEREAMRNGTCPNCGYAFQNGQGKGGCGNGFGRGNGGFGGNNGGFGRGGRQGMGGMGMTAPNAQAQQPQANGFNGF